MPKKLRATHPQTGESFSFTWNRTDREPDRVDLESIYKEWKRVNGPHGASGEWESPSLLKKVAEPFSDQSIGGYLDKARNAVSRAGEFYAGAAPLPGTEPRYDIMEQAINKPDSALEPPSQMLADALVPKGTYEGKGIANVGKGLAHGAAAVVGGFADPENLAVAPLLGSLPARVLQIGMALMAAGKANEARQVLQSQGITGEAADKAMQALALAGMAWVAGPKKLPPRSSAIEPEIMPNMVRPPMRGVPRSTAPEVIDITPTSVETVRTAPRQLPPPPKPEVGDVDTMLRSQGVSEADIAQMSPKVKQQTADLLASEPANPEVRTTPETPNFVPPPRGSRAAGTNPRAMGTNPRATMSAEERAAKRIADRLRRIGKNPNDVLMVMLRDTRRLRRMPLLWQR